MVAYSFGQERSGDSPAQKTTVEYHRFTAVSYKLPLVDLFVGAGQLIAEMNGIARAGHAREKLTWLVAYAETTRALIHAAAHNCRLDDGIAYPDPLLTNMAKLHFASHYHDAVHRLQDLAGGLLVTAPGLEDWEHPEIGKRLEHYLGSARGTARERAAVLAVHAVCTQKMSAAPLRQAQGML